MASAPSPMRNEFYSALYKNVMDSMSFKVQKRAMEKQEMAIAKRRLALEDAQLKIAAKELMLKNMELDCKLREQTNPKGLLGTKMGDANEDGKSE